MEPSYRLKLKRALEHLQTLDLAVQRWANTEPCVISYEGEVQTRKHILVQRTIRKPNDPLLGLLIGDAVHNMRQALDHLAYRLAIRVHGTDPPKNANSSMWPIRTKTKLASAIANDVGPKNKMPAGMFTAIEGFQEDAGSDGVLLEALSTLDNRDKHRSPPLVAGLAETVDLEGLHASGGVEIPGQIYAGAITGVGLIRLGAFEDGRVIVRAGSEMEVNVRPTASIAFDQSYDVAPGELVLPLLKAIHDAIIDRLFPAMEQYL